MGFIYGIWTTKEARLYHGVLWELCPIAYPQVQVRQRRAHA